MIHYLRQEEKNRSRKLWEEIFTEDSQSFVDFYYAEKCRRNRILVAEEENEIVAMLHRNPFDVVVKDRIWKIDYVAGVATAAAWRHQGYMSRLPVSYTHLLQRGGQHHSAQRGGGRRFSVPDKISSRQLRRSDRYPEGSAGGLL